MASPTGLCDHRLYTQRCRWVATISQCRLNHQLRVPMATTSPGQGQDKGTCRFSGKGTHLRRMSSCTESDATHPRAGSARQHTHVPNPPHATVPQHRQQLGWEGATSLGGAQQGQGFLPELHRLLEFLATNTVPAQAVGVGWGCQQRAPASPGEEWEQEAAAPWREMSTCENN